MEPRSFRTPEAFRAWLARHGATKPELVLRCFKVHAADRGVTYAQALDEALCYGWIDGVRRSVDADSFSVRFTPRRPSSVWSAVNVAHVERLRAAGRMTPAGLDAYARRTPEKTGVYSFERPSELAPAYVTRFQSNPEAWRDYSSRPAGYRRITTHWIMSAKQEATRLRRLETLMACSARGEPIPQLDRRPVGREGT